MFYTTIIINGYKLTVSYKIDDGYVSINDIQYLHNSVYGVLTEEAIKKIVEVCNEHYNNTSVSVNANVFYT